MDKVWENKHGLRFDEFDRRSCPPQSGANLGHLPPETNRIILQEVTTLIEIKSLMCYDGMPVRPRQVFSFLVQVAYLYFETKQTRRADDFPIVCQHRLTLVVVKYLTKLLGSPPAVRQKKK